MAGDWIKMRGNLWDDPRVGRLCDITESAEGPVIGALYWLWATADQHTEDGFMPGLTLRQIDRKTGLAGFAAALCQIGWLVDGPEGVVIVKFEEHNGASAKRRGMEAQRKANGRKDSAPCPHDVRNVSASDADKTRTESGRDAELEKRREEKSNTQANACDGAQAAPTKPKRGIRLPDNWFLPQAWGQWALDKYPHWTPEVIREEALKFANHWRSKTGKDAAKLDWYATWQNWCMSDICQRAHPPPSKQTETNYARQMRERVEQAAGSMAHIVAAKAPGYVRPPEPWEIAAHEQHRAIAARVGGSDLFEAHGSVRPGLLEPVRGD